MRPVARPNFDAKSFVAKGYDACGEAYTASREASPPEWLTLLTGSLPDGAALLDIGCGGGVPIARALAERYAVTGVDISAGQIERARRNVPRAAFIHGDVMTQEFASGRFDAAAMLYTLFHLPRDEQAEIFGRLHSWLKPDGRLLVSLADTSHAGYIEDDFFDTSMYWSHFGEHDTTVMLEAAGFEIVSASRIGHGYSDATRTAEFHPLVLARKVAAN